MKIHIVPDKTDYYPGEYLKGIIKVIPNRKTYLKDIKDIEMSFFFNEEWNYLTSENKYETQTNTQYLSIFNVGIQLFLDEPNISEIILEPKEYKFPFELKLPDYLLPSFEYPQTKFRAFLRYKLNARPLFPKNSFVSSIFINIKSIPKKDNNNLDLKTSLPIKKWGLFDKGQTTFKAICLTKNYKITDIIPVEVEIDNINSQIKVNECKLKVNRKIIFRNKDDFSEKYSNEENIIKKVFKSVVPKKGKKNFNFDLDLKEIKNKNCSYNGYTNPYKNIKNIADLMPSFDGNIINCEYFLIVKLKFSHLVPKEDRPQSRMPIYIVHKLDEDHIKKAKEKAAKIKEEERKNNDEEFFKEFEIIDNEKPEKEIDNKNINNNNINNNKNIVENKNDKINLDDKNSNNCLYNQNNINQEEYDLPSRDSLLRIYQNNNNQNEKNNNEGKKESKDIIDINECNNDDSKANPPSNNQISNSNNNNNFNNKILYSNIPNKIDNNLNNKKDEIQNNNKIIINNNLNNINKNNNFGNNINNNVFAYPSFDDININNQQNNQNNNYINNIDINDNNNINMNNLNRESNFYLFKEDDDTLKDNKKEEIKNEQRNIVYDDINAID